MIPRDQHTVSRGGISDNALKVLYRLKKAGYDAYLVGGGVRDMLLGKEPKDFDVATNALPEQVRDLFRNCRLIGRRFRLAHVRFGREIVEVATFRGAGAEIPEDVDAHMRHDSGLILRDNLYGTIEEDAFRRDFTVNALYYNIDDFSVIDFADGIQDLNNNELRVIGDPEMRYREDPVRMLRAVRFAAKLGFSLESKTEKPIKALAESLREIPPARLFEEVIKLFMFGHAVQTFELLKYYDLFRQLFPMTHTHLTGDESDVVNSLITKALADTDQRVIEGKPVTPAFLFAVLLWEPTRRRSQDMEQQGAHELDALKLSSDEVCKQQQEYVAIPRRYAVPMKEIFQLQWRLKFTKGRRAKRNLAHPRFRAGYDFLKLRAETGQEDTALAAWWTEAQTADTAGNRAASEEPARRKRRNRNFKRRSNAGKTN